jgi:hypothetical protein
MGASKLRVGFVASLLAALAGVASGQPAADGSAVDPDAIAALERMGGYLRSVKVFRVQARVTRDLVLDNGLLAESESRVDVLAQLPSHLRVDTSSAEKERMFFYDGKTFTIYGKRNQYYASVPAPDTVAKLTADLADKYDIEMPLSDLFLWGTDRVDAKAITAAVDLGPADVEETTCQQYAFRQGGVDWQVWIKLGAYPLPLKMVITTTTDEARPNYSAIYDWDLAPSFNEATFTFDPPEGAKRIVLVQAPSGQAR